MKSEFEYLEIPGKKDFSMNLEINKVMHLK